MSSYRLTSFSRLFSYIFILLIASFGLEGCGGSSSPSSPADIITPDPVVRTLQSISIAPFINTLPKGSEQGFTVTGLYSDNSNEDISQQVTWSVDNSTNASVDNSGKLQALKAGTVTITAQAEDNLSVSKQLTITDVTLDSIEIIPAIIEISAGIQKKITAIGYYSDGSYQDITEQVSWQSSNTSVSTFSGATLTALTAGQAKISGSIGNVTATADLQVTSALLERIEINPFNNVMVRGSSQKLLVNGFFSDYSSQDITDQVSWQIADNSIISIDDETAVLSAVIAGSSNLTANYEGYSDVVSVQVTSNISLVGIEIQPTNPVVIAGQRQAFKATAIYSDHTNRDITQFVNWTTSDASLVEIDNRINFNGEAYTHSVGSPTITASYKQQTASTRMTIQDAELVNIELSPSNIDLVNGLQQQFSATAYFSDGSQQLVTDQVNWSSSDNQVSFSTGEKAGLFKANAVGSSNIIATLDGQQFFTRLKVIEAELNELLITVESLSLPTGISQKLQAIGEYSDGSSVDLSQQVIWQVIDPEVISISYDSTDILMTGLNPGSSSITANLGQVSSSINITVDSAVLQQIQLLADSGSLSINQQRQISAEGHFSDGSTQDLTNQVIWASDKPELASVANSEDNPGLVTASAIGQVNIIAVFSDITSENLAITIVDDPNLPSAVTIQATPNVIFNNGTDTTTLTFTVKPLQEQGVIADGTAIDITIIEDGESRVEQVLTLDGIATVELSSQIEGFISIQAEISDFDVLATTSVLSTSNFIQVLSIIPVNNVEYSEGVYLQGSQFGLYMRNLSNREFILTSFQAANGGVSFADSPVTDPNFLSGGVLSAGEYTGIAYQLDFDTVDNGISIGYTLKDETTDEEFGFILTYTQQ